MAASKPSPPSDSESAQDKVFSNATCAKLLAEILHRAADNEDVRVLFALQGVSNRFRATIQGSEELCVHMGLAHPTVDDGKYRDSVLQDPISRIKAPVSHAHFAELGKRLELGPFEFSKIEKNRVEITYHVPDDVCAKHNAASTIGQQNNVVLGFQGKTKVHTSIEDSWRKVKILQSAVEVQIIVHITLTPAAQGFVAKSGQSRCVVGGYEEKRTFAAKDATLGRLVTALEEVRERDIEAHKGRAEKSWSLWCGSKPIVDLASFWREKKEMAAKLLKETQEREATEAMKKEMA